MLLKPLIAIGVMILKIFVAIGYWITNPQPAQPSEGAPPAEFNYVVSRSDRSLRAVSMQLVGGERFEMLRIEIVPRDARATSGSVDAGRPLAFASLASDRGRAMRCDFYPGAVVRCATAEGERYEIALEPFAVVGEPAEGPAG